MSADPILAARPLGFPWETVDPFLFCVHHDDDYPEGNEQMGPSASLAGRNLGSDFVVKDGWRMYHGQRVPGFPQHPHRGFETITIARKGYIDHSDSLGATARFGHGDVQWMTAGSGIVHSEMFPLVNRDDRNRTELFQIWLNLPAADKMVDPYFTMLWNEDIPRIDRDGVDVAVIAGSLDGLAPPSPPPDSWATRPDSHVQILTIRLDPGATWRVPTAPLGVHRALYFFEGGSLTMGDAPLSKGTGYFVRPEAPLVLQNGQATSELLMLQGRPIGEPVAHHGPFVMNSRAELQQAYDDYRRTRFGGWPWKGNGPVHPRESGRFAVHADGRAEAPKA